MVWLFIILTVVTYSFVMKRVLNHVVKPVSANRILELDIQKQNSFNPNPTTR